MRGIVARLDPGAAGFPLKVYVAVTLERHDDRGHRRFAEAVRAMPEVISADWVTGEIDALLYVRRPRGGGAPARARPALDARRRIARDDAAPPGGAQARLAAAARAGGLAT